jgi:hypothetical protein
MPGRKAVTENAFQMRHVSRRNPMLQWNKISAVAVVAVLVALAAVLGNFTWLINFTW